MDDEIRRVDFYFGTISYGLNEALEELSEDDYAELLKAVFIKVGSQLLEISP